MLLVTCSGIYVGGTPLNYTFNTGNTHINTLLVSQVPVRSTMRLPRTPVLARSPVLPPPAAAASGPGQRITTFQASPGFSKDMSVVSGDVTCHVSINVSTAGDNSATPDTFGVFAWEGVGFSGLLPLRLCAVALCPPGVVPLCSQVDIHTHTEFTRPEPPGYRRDDGPGPRPRAKRIVLTSACSCGSGAGSGRRTRSP